jgi:hypothetical protein
MIKLNAAAGLPVILTMLLATFGCQKKTNNEQNKVEENKVGTFGYDLAFLKKHKEVVVLTAPDAAAARIIVVADYQGRVMTSTSDGDAGNSYGWLNYDLIQSGEIKPHMNAFGGEERFWLSPEGGQFSVYFKKGAKFDFDNWQTPPLIDSEAFEVVSTDSSHAHFRKQASLENHSGTKFDFTIDRTVSMLDRAKTKLLLGIGSIDKVKSVAFETANTLTNTGPAWTPETGAVGVWILGMFTPGEKTTIVAPYSRLAGAKPLLTDNYFGSIPSDRLRVDSSAIFLKADGKFRSKIGLAPMSAKPVAGSYDAEKGILTIVQYDMDAQGDYLKSTWEHHKEPYKGDALNAYNDGALEDGSQMGPFYELESNSSVKFLRTNEKLTHHHRTFHFEGDQYTLNEIALKVLGVRLDDIVSVFK